MADVLGVAEAKRRFSELIERVRAGERFVVTRRGRPVIALVAPQTSEDDAEPQRYLGLAAFAGALADWEEIDDFVRELYESRRRARDRAVPDVG
jgi:prevent-host-death family protein